MSCKPIGHLNVRSLFTSFNEFTNIILRNYLDIVAVSETWLSYDICSDIVKITGYKLYRRDRFRCGGGVGIYVKNLFPTEVVLEEFLDIDAFEHLWIRVRVCNSILKHEFYKTYIKTRVRFAARLLQVPVNDECT
jgi:hypothetical protein